MARLALVVPASLANGLVLEQLEPALLVVVRVVVWHGLGLEEELLVVRLGVAQLRALEWPEVEVDQPQVPPSVWLLGQPGV